ncbi:MAG: hypothetical protein HY898_07605 [Deltaproteobacteria bacterium]|nr:hypothetical protein [Deltaproteobacteria bacterium]
MKKTPLQIVKDRFGDKAKLVEALAQFTNEDMWVNRLNAAKGLETVSNAKLLRLFDTFSAVKEKFGTRAKMIDAIIEIEKRTKDAGYRSRLERYPVPRLFDMYRSLARRQARAAAATKAKEADKPAPAAKAAPAAKKPRATKKA